MSPARTRFFLMLLVAWCTSAAPAHADPAAPNSSAPAANGEGGEISRAREAFLLGLGLSRAGQWTDALAEFQRSAQLKPHPVTTFNIAYCERSLGLHASAYQHFLAALAADGAQAGERLPAAFEEEARAYVAEAIQRVAHAHVGLASSDLILRIDGKPVRALHPEAGALIYVVGADATDEVALPAAFDLWLDPGRHLFSASQPGQPEILKSLDVTAGGSIEVELGVLRTPVKAPRQRARAQTAPQKPGPTRTLALGMFGLSAVSLVTSGTFALLALSHKHALDAEKCPNRVCPPPYHSEELEMKNDATAATVSLAVSAVAAGVGTYLLLSEKPERSESSRGFQLEPRIGLGSAGIAGRF